MSLKAKTFADYFSSAVFPVFALFKMCLIVNVKFFIFKMNENHYMICVKGPGLV